jgi:hypothetical protein
MVHYSKFKNKENVKVNLYFCLIRYHIMKTYGGVEAYLHALLTMTLDGVK